MQADVSSREAEVENGGRKIKVRYHPLTWAQLAEARDAAMFYERGAPKYLRAFKYAEEKLLRMVESVDGKPFTKADYLAWPPDFGDAVVRTLGLLRSDSADETFPEAPGEGGEGIGTPEPAGREGDG